jgi:hypothetical protein
VSSNLTLSAKFCSVRLSVRTPAFHAGKRSSILLQSANIVRHRIRKDCKRYSWNLPVNLSDVAGYGHQVGQPPTNNRGIEKRHLESLISSSSWFDSGSRNQIRSRSLLVRISPCHGDGTSSILVETARLFRSSKHGVGGGLLIHEAWFDSRDRSQTRVKWPSGPRQRIANP